MSEVMLCLGCAWEICVQLAFSLYRLFPHFSHETFRLSFFEITGFLTEYRIPVHQQSKSTKVNQVQQKELIVLLSLS